MARLVHEEVDGENCRRQQASDHTTDDV